MIEQDAGACKQLVSFPVVRDLPMRGRFGDGVGTAGAKRRTFFGRQAARIAETFA